MRKIVLFLLFCSLALCCYAQEGLRTGENNDVPPIYPGLSFSLFGFGNDLGSRTAIFGHSFGNTALNNGSTVWKHGDLGLTRYAEYENKSFFEAATPVLKVILMLGGVAAFFGGIYPITQDDIGLGVSLIMVGCGSYIGGMIWLLTD